MPPRLFPALLALLASSPAAQAAGSFTVTTLTGDANSGIAADSSYTHAIDVFDTANAKINGAVFTGSGAGANPSSNNYSTSGFNNGFNGFDALANDGISGGVGAMMTNFLYNGNPETVFTKDELLTNITLYWVTQTAASSARIYYESRHAPPATPGRRIEVPTACADFPKEIIWSPRKWLEQRYNITRWTEMPRGGHFAAFEQPQLLIDDVRAFFGTLRKP